MEDSLTTEGRPAGKVGAAELERIVGRLAPLAATGLPARRALAMLAPPGAGGAEDGASLAELARWDPAIAANCLAAAAERALPPSAISQSFSISQALSALGEEAVRSIALAALARRWPVANGNGPFRQQLWRHSLAAALAARMLAERAGLAVAPDEAATCGLLHDVGKLGMLQAMPKSYARVLESLELEGGGDLLAREHDLLGVDHALFGRRLARAWRLGEAVEQAAWLHHQPLDSPILTAASRLRAGLVQLADALARELTLGFSGNSSVPARAEQLAEQLGVAEDALRDVRQQLPAECELLCERLGVGEVPAGGRATARLAEASIEHLSGADDDLRRRGAALRPRARAMELFAPFAQDHCDETPLPQLLADLGSLFAAALGLAPRQRPSLVVYAALEEEGAFAAVCPGEGGSVSVRTLHVRSRGEGVPPLRASGILPAEAPEAQGPPGQREPVPSRYPPIAAAAMLGDSSDLAGWPDPDDLRHVPLVAGGEWVGGLLAPPAASLAADETLAALAPAVAAWLSIFLQRRRAVDAGERLADEWSRLSAARDALAESKALAAVGEMAAGAAHEINNPLAVISGRAQLMAERAADAEEKKVWRLIVEQSQRISDIITGLVELANPPRPAPAAVGAAGLLSEAAGAFAAGGHPQAAALKVDIESAPELPPAWADREQMVAVLCELLANAASAGAKRVVLGAKESPELGVVLTVADDGEGMDAATLASAFTPLFSLQAAGRKRGLGLPKARRTVEAVGGRLWIRSEPRKGTTVFVQLPAAGKRPEF